MSFKGEKTRSIRIMMGIALITVVTMLIILTGGKAVNAEGASLSEGFKIYCIPDVNISDYSSNNPIPETKKAYLVGGDSVSTVNGLSWDAETNTLTFSGYSGGPVYVGDPNAKTLNNINIVVNKNNNIGSLKNSNSDSVNATLALVNVDAKMTGSGMLTVYNEYSNGYGYCFDTRGNLTIGEAGGSGPNLFLYSGYDTVSVNSEWRFDSTTGAEFNMGGNLTINSGNMMVQMEPATKGGNTYLTNNSAIFADKNIDITGGAFMIVLSWTDKETEKKPYGIFAAGSSISAANANIMVSVDYRAGEVPLFYVPKGTNDDSNNTDKISEVESLNKTVTYDISDVKANLTPSDYEYEGADKTYEPKVEIPGLIEGTDFIVTDYNNNKAPGKANLLIEGRGKFSGYHIEYFTITESLADLPNYNQDILTTPPVYDGQAHTIITDDLTSEDILYTVSEEGDAATQTKAGSYRTILTPKVGYKWKDGTIADKVIEWSIAKKPVTINGIRLKDKIYDATKDGAINEITFNGLVDGESIGEDDYKASVSYKEINASETPVEVNVTITLDKDGNYTFKDASDNDTLEKKIVTDGIIKQAGIDNDDVDVVDDISNITYDGTPKEPAVKVYSKSLRRELVKDVDYEVTYENNDHISQNPDDSAMIIVKGINNFCGEYIFPFVIHKGLKPVMVEVKNVSVEGKSDGEISAAEDGLLYKAEGETEFKAVQNKKITGLSVGTYIFKWSDESIDDLLYTGTKEEKIEITFDEHDWGEPTYTIEKGNDDVDWVTAKRVCKQDSSHEESETRAVYHNVTEATCTADGKIEYFSQTFMNEAFQVWEKTETIPAKGHDWGEWTVIKAATTTEKGLRQRICKNDSSHVETEEIPMLPSGGSGVNPSGTTPAAITPAAGTASDGSTDAGAGVGKISADGKKLTDNDGVIWYMNEQLSNADLQNGLNVAVKGGGKYKITKITKKKGKITGGNATYVAPYDKDTNKVVIPKRVKLSGVYFKVTAISASACKDCKNLTSVTIGENVSKIGGKAFNGCGNLKNINIKCKKLKTVGGKAFGGINAKAKFKLGKKKFSKYKKLVKKAGAPKKATFKK